MVKASNNPVTTIAQSLRPFLHVVLTARVLTVQHRCISERTLKRSTCDPSHKTHSSITGCSYTARQTKNSPVAKLLSSSLNEVHVSGGAQVFKSRIDSVSCSSEGKVQRLADRSRNSYSEYYSEILQRMCIIGVETFSHDNTDIPRHVAVHTLVDSCGSDLVIFGYLVC